MNEFRADLHCHTTCSDGSISPQKIIQLAKQVGLHGLSIADHDTIDAYPKAIPEAKAIGIELISGVEFSAVHNNSSVHILGYSFNLNSPELLTFCNQHRARRETRNRAMLELLEKHKMPLTMEDVLAASPLAEGSLGRPHIALAMVKKGYVPTPQDAFKRYLAEDCSCYVRGDNFTAEETINIIHQAQGFAIIAHPHLLKDRSLFSSLLDIKFDGLEGYYGRYLPHHNATWVTFAEKRNWIVTGGSDFHGEIKPQISLGCAWVGEKTFRFLKDHFDKVNVS